MIRRTELLRCLKQQLAEHRVVYLSAYFSTGKSVLVHQFAESCEQSSVYDCLAAQDASLAGYGLCPPKLLVVDNLHGADEEWISNELVPLIERLPMQTKVLLAGRAKLPPALRMLNARGEVGLLDNRFLAFSQEEIREYFLEYGIRLRPADLQFLQDAGQGWALVLSMTAQRMARDKRATPFSLRTAVSFEARAILRHEIFAALPENDRILLTGMAAFREFTGDMARFITGQPDAVDRLRHIAETSYFLLFTPPDSFRMFPFVHEALTDELQNARPAAYIAQLYARAALYCELQRDYPQAMACHLRAGSRERICELLIRCTAERVSMGYYIEAQPYYRMMTEAEILASPGLMKGMSILSSLTCCPDESERWYKELADFAARTARTDARRRAAEEALAYLDIALPHRTNAQVVGKLLHAGLAFADSASWRKGFNIAGNSAGIVNGGKDFSSWVRRGRRLYTILKAPIERALGGCAAGLGNIALGEALYLSGEDAEEEALALVCRGAQEAGSDWEMRFAALGVQSRMLLSRGCADQAITLIEHLMEELPQDQPRQLRQNIYAHLLSLRIITGDTAEALNWLAQDAPDETAFFHLLDRYRYLLKLRLYLLTGQWSKTTLLVSLMRTYAARYNRPYLMIQLDLMEALILKRNGSDLWLQRAEEAVALAEKWQLIRVIAEEGAAAAELLGAMHLPDTPWHQRLMGLTRQQAARYPHHLQNRPEHPLLTEREQEVFRLMAAGCRNARIADMLGITERTVKHHSAQIYQKLGVASRAEAIARAAEMGEV